MLSVLVANPKGGCGKSTLATNLAAAFANSGMKTALADVDPQKSSLTWLKLRPQDAAKIEGLNWLKNEGEMTKGLHRLVIDVGAGIPKQHFDVLLKAADLVVMPVLPSIFDETTTGEFLQKVETLKPISKGTKPIAIVGNRMRANTRAAGRLEAFLDDVGHQVVTRLSDRSAYSEMASQGLSVFDRPGAHKSIIESDWMPLIQFVESQDWAYAVG
ncbi:MAG: AAA family ATPase [Alphaproteobacteria bacterium]|nr:AAA family ATPase [Alphaproteobacteria bacterium]